MALTSCAAAIGLELACGQYAMAPVNPFLTGFGAVIFSGAWAGAGPGLMSTMLLAVWSGYDLAQEGLAISHVVLLCSLFGIDGVLLALGSSRMWRSIKEAAESERWHRQLVETAAEGIWVHDEQGTISYANARMGEILRVRTEDLQGRNVEEFFLPKDLSMERVRAANLSSRQQFDRRLRRSDGTEAWVLACCNPIQQDRGSGTVSRALEMMTDITERKRAEHALVRSEQRFRNLFESVLEGVYQSTPDGRILAANPMLLQMLGLKNEAELNDVHIARDLYVDPGIRQRLLEQLERDGGFQNVEYELRRRDGQIITVLENARVERDETGGVLYYEGTLTDITRSKRMEEQLRQAQKVEALGRLAGGIAQDFNNVLTLITGFAQLALSELPPSHGARLNTEQVVHASESALALTRQLLSFSRRHAPPESSIDLNQAIQRSEAVRVAGIGVALAMEELPVYASLLQIDLIIRELSSRVSAMARRHKAAARLELRTAAQHLNETLCSGHANMQPGHYAVLSIGIAERADERRMPGSPDGPFAVMQPGEGAAMGLSVMQATVMHCGGFVVRHADTGFSAFLPRALQAIAARPGLADTEQGETILLVEDEPLVRELSRDMLERQGYRVILAANAVEAERLSATAGGFDLLITDTHMPQINGAELARRLRVGNPALKVLYISGYAENDQPERHDIAIDGAAFLQKPFSADSLGRKIRQMLQGE
jgi:two-component system, cell cycle sensor histidine kinase and response regulator CckA